MPKDFLERMKELMEKKLTPEDKEKAKRERYIGEAEGLANRFLNIPSYRVEDLTRDLSKYEGDAKDIVTKVILSKFVKKVNLSQNNKRVVEGISALGSEYAEKIKEVESLRNEREQAIQQRYTQLKKEIERPIRERLNQLKISGSAIGDVNVEANEAWYQILSEINLEYDKKLDIVKQKLLSY